MYVVEWFAGHWDGWRECNRFASLSDAKRYAEDLRRKRRAEVRIVTEKDGYVTSIVER